jgi:uncharacterized membrane protein YqjE
MNGSAGPRGPEAGAAREAAAPGAAPDDEQGSFAAERDASPARELSLHLLRMLETRMDAAGIALQGETQLLLARLQLKLFAAAAIFIAIWGGIVLLAIALPPHLRVPVLSAVVVTFVVLAIAAQMLAKRKASNQEVGSLHWFLDSLRQDLEVLSRTLAHRRASSQPDPRNGPHDLAA